MPTLEHALLYPGSFSQHQIQNKGVQQAVDGVGQILLPAVERGEDSDVIERQQGHVTEVAGKRAVVRDDW